MTATPDTTITIPSSGNARNAQTWAVHVFRGVDPTTPFDGVATVYASGTATGRPNPGAITPATAGAWILRAEASAAGTGAAYTAPTNESTNYRTRSEVDTYDSMIGFGYYTGWTSGSYDPAAISAGGTTGATDSWVAETMVLRPEPIAADAGYIKVWTGSAWAVKPLKVWNGSAWVIKPIKHWTGSQWKLSKGA